MPECPVAIIVGELHKDRGIISTTKNYQPSDKSGMFLESLKGSKINIMAAREEHVSVIPEQQRGNELNVEYSATAPSVKEAIANFQKCIQRLLDVNNWKAITNAALSDFQLTDEDGRLVNREAREGDLFKIKIPAPGPAAGEGYDWVKVEMIITRVNRVAMRVRPAESPFHPEAGTAHFFSSDATSTFQVFRKGREITAGVYGRNEIPNTGSDAVADKVRNTAVAVGAIMGASRIQWESLVHGIAEGERKS